MITFVTIKEAVVDLLKSKFTIPVVAQDVEKGFARPSLTVIIDEPTVTQLECTDEIAATVQVYYFPDIKDTKKSLDILEVQYEMPKLFGNKLQVADRYLDVIEPSSVVTDGIYIFEFDLLFEDQVHEDDADVMQNLEFNT